MTSEVKVRLESSRKDLLDLGLRNPMINFGPRRVQIQVVDELSTETFRILIDDGKSMSFLPLPEKLVEATLENEREAPTEDIDWSSIFESEGASESRHTDNKLQTRLSAEALTRRLLRIESGARTYIEEQGVNILYLALGFLTWLEADASEQGRKAPLLLIPVHLKRDSARDNFTISYTEEDIELNLSLAAKLNNEFGIKLPEASIDDAAAASDYLAKVEKIVRRRRWKVEPNSIALSFFSFGKYLMYRDLDPSAWPTGYSPDEHPVLQALLHDGFGESEGLLSDDTQIDEILEPDELHQVVDSDSSQTLALLDINKGHHLVIQGPPGTGKSQTITNVIAEALAQGKTTLFVSEKMAALEVVKRRLDQVNLGVAALELHSYKSNKRAILAELEQTLGLAKSKLLDTEDDIQTIKRTMDHLNRYCDAINRPILDSGVTPNRAIGEYLALGTNATELPRVDFQHMREWDAAKFNSACQNLHRVAVRLRSMGTPEQNPFWGAKIAALLPVDEPQLQSDIQELREQVTDVWSVADNLATRMGVERPESTVATGVLAQTARHAHDAPNLSGICLTAMDWQSRPSEIDRLISSGTEVKSLRDSFEDRLIDEAWDQNLLSERSQYASYGNKWYRLLVSDFRRAQKRLAGLCRSQLPKDSEDCLELIDAVLRYRRELETYDYLSNLGHTLFGSQWQGVQSDWQSLEGIARWVEDTNAKINDGKISEGILAFLEESPSVEGLDDEADQVMQLISQLESDLAHVEDQLDFRSDDTSRPERSWLSGQSFDYQRKIIQSWVDQFPKALRELALYNAISRELQSQGLGFLTEMTDTWDRAPEYLVPALKASWYHGLLDEAFRTRPEIVQFDRPVHENDIKRFCDLDELLFQHNQARLVRKHWENLPNRQGGGEVGLLRREFNKKRRHIPIRKLIEGAGRAIQALKPVFMMSPMSVATYLPRGSIEFDLVIFDEASQVRPVEAFGAILRGKQIVVVGDSKQLPPTNFFEVLSEDDTDDDDGGFATGDLESILGLFSSQGAPDRMLRWHYRSRHESLIALSNQAFYDNRLVIFPSPGANQMARGLTFNYLPNTVYDRGKSRCNKLEAEAVAASVMQHAREHPELTLGVAAFSSAQRDAIIFALEALRRKDGEYEEFFRAHPHEPFFVKNLENVQGDERDVIFISIGYGKDAGGYLSHSFGPLNREGGERRLNVLITRARLQCHVFSNFKAADLDLERSRTQGVAALKQFLAYADDGILDLPTGSLGEAESPFEEQVVLALASLGYRVETQIGCAGFRIDLGIVDPKREGRYLLGIECDGATYHSARSARDRDRLREQVLKNLGWRLHRVWSTDWFRSPDDELRRIQESITRAEQYWYALDEGEAELAATEHTKQRPFVIQRHEEHEPASAMVAQPYQKVTLSVDLIGRELHEVPIPELAEYVKQVVAVEGPVHKQVIVERITKGAGLARAGRRIQDAIERAVQSATRQSEISKQGDFLAMSGTEEIQLRDRSELESAEKRSEWIGDAEIKLAIIKVVQDAFSIEEDEATAIAMGVLGIKRRNQELQTRLKSLVRQLIRSGKLSRESDDRLIIGETS